MRFLYSIIFLVIYCEVFSQATDSIPVLERTIKVTDPFYREDQFYVGVTHTMLLNQPANYTPRSISIGTNFGFLRDIPINQQRTFAIAPGFGFALYNLRHNLALVDYELPNYVYDNNPKKNVQKLSYVEFPIEIRWRTSKVHSHKFWRVYGGFKYSYLLNGSSKYEGVYGTHTYINKDLFHRSNVGVYVSAGFNTWNFYAYYGFTPLYKKGTADTNREHLNMLNLGLIFYIL